MSMHRIRGRLEVEEWCAITWCGKDTSNCLVRPKIIPMCTAPPWTTMDCVMLSRQSGEVPAQLRILVGYS